MPLYDNRVFRDDKLWWAAEVHGRSGVERPGQAPQYTSEQIVFTCLSDERASSGVILGPGELLRISHHSVVELANRSRPLLERIRLTPTNTPDEDELTKVETPQSDKEGLRWIVKPRLVPQIGIVSPGGPTGPISDTRVLDVICLDDSALRHSIGLESMDTYGAFLKQHGKERAALTLIDLVKARYRELTDAQITEILAT